ncbi:hypothetical protein BKI52_37910 [marine bacterium AO1-C]|nr:hypothetical protein BKI52_37910 [marine bacterium AO1-C]
MKPWQFIFKAQFLFYGCWILVLGSLTLQVKAQELVDSLEVALKDNQANAATKAKILSELVEIYAYRDIKTAEEYVQKILRLAETHTDSTNRIIAYHSSGFIEYRKGRYSKALMWYKKALRLIDRDNHAGKDVAHTYRKLGMVYARKGDYAKALTYYQQALGGYEAVGDQRNRAVIYNAIGNVYNKRTEYQSAMKYYQKSLTLHQKLDSLTSYPDPGTQTSLLAGIGRICRIKGEYYKALEYFGICLKITHKTKDKTARATSLFYIGDVYALLKDYKKALTYYEKSLQLRLEQKDKSEAAASYNNIGKIYNQLGEYDKALEFYQKARWLINEVRNKSHLGANLLGTAATFYHAGYPNEALEYYQEALALSEKLGEKLLKAQIKIGIGQALLTNKKYQAAITQTSEGYALARKHQLKVVAKDAAQMLSNAFAQIKNYEQAYRFQIIFKNISDSLINAENIKTAASLEQKRKYEVAQQRQLLQQQKKEALLAAELKQQKRQRVLSIFGMSVTFVLILVLLLFAYYRYRIRQQHKWDSELKKQNNLKRDAVFKAQETMQKKIAQDLHDGVGQLLVALRLNLEATATPMEKNRKVWKNAFQLLDKITQDVRSISHLAMPNLIKSDGLTIALEHLLDNTFSGSQINHYFECYNLQKRYRESIEINTYRIVQELTSNVMKHAKATEVELQLYEVDDYLYIHFEDNGQGFDSTKIKNTGIGLLNIRSRVDFLAGNVSFESGENGGTCVKITLPMKSNVNHSSDKMLKGDILVA